ncbi:hypothetical protein [Candidatus Enterovibrio escicola]|uniref:hypothetical protein n=1 Tax=Candidatus Enterovibrio escicola TaxID=1927127 RepID=UPI0012382407|nr:hypothetical protein [Candidatus Enterovibrio escacola]
MADTLPNIQIAADTWVDIYAASGIAVGTQVSVINNGGHALYLYSGATAPTEAPNKGSSFGFAPVEANRTAQNQSGDAGAWVFSFAASSIINVAVV